MGSGCRMDNGGHAKGSGGRDTGKHGAPDCGQRTLVQIGPAGGCADAWTTCKPGDDPTAQECDASRRYGPSRAWR